MQRHVAAWATAVLVSAGALAQPPGKPDRAAAVQLSGSVLRIEAPRLQGGFAMGSGVVVAPGLVVTNCHVTRDAASIRVGRGGARWAVTGQLADIDHDLCLLHAPGVQADVVALGATDALVIGQAVTALGYTGGVDLQHSFGEVVDLHRLADGSVVQTSNGFNSGASGGGLFDGAGRLAGILTFRLRGADQHYYAAPVSWVRSLVDAAQAGGLPPVQPLDTRRLPYWQRTDAQQPRFLRASLMLRQQRWHDLAGLTRRWLLDDASDGEPWYLLGLALQGLSQPVEARQALDCALRLQPQRQGAQQARDAMTPGPDPVPPATASANNGDPAEPALRLAGAATCPMAA
jgi:hypothetical protein